MGSERQGDKEPPTLLVFSNFAGLQSNQDPHDLDPGAAVRQVNLTSSRKGELKTRGGFRNVTFEA